MAWVLQLLAAPASAQTYNFSPGCRLETILTSGSGIFGGTTKDCGEPGVNHEITPDTDGIPNPNNPAEAAARMEEVSPNVKKVTVSGRARQLLNGSFGDVTATARFDAGFRPHVNPVNTPTVIRVESDISAKWERGAFGSAGSVSLNVGFDCPGVETLGASAAIDSRLSGTASTKRTLKCLVTPSNPFGFLTQINLTGVAAAGSQSGKAEDMSYAGTFTVSVVPAGKELKGVSGPLETVAGVPFAQSFVVNVFRNDTDAAVSGESIVFSLKNEAGVVVETKTEPSGPDGNAAANFTAVDPGMYAVEAACAGCMGGSPTVFSLKVREVETYIEKFPGEESGDRQRSRAGEKLPLPLRVRVNDTTGKSRSGFTISFDRIAGFVEPPAAQRTTGIDGVAELEIQASPQEGAWNVRATCLDCTGLGQSNGGGGFSVAGLAGNGASVSGKEVEFRGKSDLRKAKSSKGEKGCGGVNHGPNECRAWISDQDAPPETCSSSPFYICTSETNSELSNGFLLLKGQSDLVDAVGKSCTWDGGQPLKFRESQSFPQNSCRVTVEPSSLLSPPGSSDLSVTVTHSGGIVCSAKRRVVRGNATISSIGVSHPFFGVTPAFGSLMNVHMRVMIDDRIPNEERISYLEALRSASILKISTTLLVDGTETPVVGFATDTSLIPFNRTRRPWESDQRTSEVAGGTLLKQFRLPCPNGVPPVGAELVFRVKLCELEPFESDPISIAPFCSTRGGLE